METRFSKRLPDTVVRELELRVPSLEIEKIVDRAKGVGLVGRIGNQPVQIKLDYSTKDPRRTVTRMQFQYELRSEFRSLKGKHLIPKCFVPRKARRQARLAACALQAGYTEIKRVKQGTVQGCRAYDLRARSGEWRVEVEVLRDGSVLEVELDYRPTGTASS